MRTYNSNIQHSHNLDFNNRLLYIFLNVCERNISLINLIFILLFKFSGIYRDN